ncbi:helix-turn-helix domain-containing protein [Brenneria tiliae]|uniref:helix-turn-helix domain-containing protein n=1 Tax=Brenneria tiliae TaxID=2914984 RepID=UPI002014C6F2|nr:helix-turn-helix domain-containing protein [Brenneria tiliae]MCL2900333.1 helix-turn-helix domain-containing protein [Brenneria tiliae]MCL2904180.1 helix-turn-helix domain-containing protein [Brenneria tiliae]
MNTNSGPLWSAQKNKLLLSGPGVDIRQIVILTYTDCFLGDVVKLLEMLTSLNSSQPGLSAEKIEYVTHIYSLYGGSVSSPATALMNMETQAMQISRPLDIDILIIAHGPQQAISTPPDSTVNWLRAICSQSRCVVALGAGIFLLAATGLLHQRTVTTYSSLVSRLIAGYPTLRVKKSADFQRDGKFYTTSERINIKEMAQLLLRADRGENGNDSRRVESSVSTSTALCPLNSIFTRPQSIAYRVTFWWLTHIDQDLNMAQSADFLAMSERSFRRHFKLQTGYSPSLFLLLLRLELSRQALIDSDLPIDKIARRCGLLDGQQLARIFRKFIGTSPHLYRETKRQENLAALHPAYGDLFNARALPQWLSHFLTRVSPEKKQSILICLQRQSAVASL